MLENLSEQIRNCYEHAEFCARKATEQSDPLLKRDYLELEQRWLTLARSYDLSERASDFTDGSALSEQVAQAIQRMTA
jgi:hypothetical protein